MKFTRSLKLVAAIVAFLAPPSAFAFEAGDMKYVGTTAPEEYDGAQGVSAPHLACQARFNAVWCTSQMIIEHGPHFFAPAPPDDGAWVQPAPVGIGQSEGGQLVVIDFSGRQSTSCGGWTTANVGVKGLTWITVEPGVTRILEKTCGTPRPAACCGGNVFLPGIILLDPDPPDPR